jgi:multimeric flavodoxin WrbA
MKGRKLNISTIDILLGVTIVKILIMTCSPNKDGLTESCGRAAKSGVEAGNGEATMVRLNDLDIRSCEACEHGWGTCLKDHRCKLEDDFEPVHESMGQADGFIIITPVYWWDMSESAKSFFDRLRRCEASLDPNKVQDKPYICVAAAGGTGHGTLACLTQMDRLFLHMNHLNYRGIKKFDYIGVTQRNKTYMIEAIRAAAEKMALHH